MRAKIISVVNQKGGVGKTTTSVNLSAALSTMNRKTLIIDLDAQGNSSSGFGIAQQDRNNTIYHALVNVNKLTESIIKTNIPNLDIISANNNLAGAELEIANLPKREYILSNLLMKLNHQYDYIIIDCAPSLNLLAINALTASDEILIPMMCDFYSLEGLSHLLKIVDVVKKNLNDRLKICGILFTMYDSRNRLTEAVEKDVRNCLGNLVFKTIIPRNVKLSEAPSYGKPGIIYDHRCSGSIAYMKLTQEILFMEEINNEKS
jgi:chromosome partitioning protein